ncbi:putative sigma-54 modulation protein [Syntrophus gentianae]|uniref:Ribosome hibernation promoting factor n=1 Tax=Syntrophus gentianae TaxID=43775 RepID=A0A1H7WZC0_9BACT|nr:ribosome-associated translation inhibitor RaiA [Syntrophus gentianae]SEM26317.1 putative sigma-54 modulation protein [Syntrophus gentianae]
MMKISVTFRNTEDEGWQKEYVDDRMKKLNKYIDAPADVHVVLTVEKFRNVAEINVLTNGLNIIGKEESKDMHLAIDNAVEKIERQLKKHREKIRVHKSGALKEEGEEAEASPVEMEEVAESRIVETRKVILKPMSLDDAVMEMDSTKNRFVVYRNASSESVNVIYRRDDGGYLLIETNG